MFERYGVSCQALSIFYIILWFPGIKSQHCRLEKSKCWRGRIWRRVPQPPDHPPPRVPRPPDHSPPSSSASFIHVSFGGLTICRFSTKLKHCGRRKVFCLRPQSATDASAQKVRRAGTKTLLTGRKAMCAAEQACWETTMVVTAGPA